MFFTPLKKTVPLATSLLAACLVAPINAQILEEVVVTRAQER